jgi:short-subunit dehydrogenase
MKPKNYFSEKTAVVTGASSGLGQAISKKLASRGATVFAAARNTEQLCSLQADATQNSPNGSIIPITTDIRDPESVACLFQHIDEQRGKIDFLINNAAHGHHEPLQDISFDQIESIVRTNLMGSIYATRHALERMLLQGDGQLVFVSSLAGKLAFPELSVYSATKFGIEGFASAIREELSGSGIHVSVIRPGVMDTDFFRRAGMNPDKYSRKQDPNVVAEKILNAITREEQETVIGQDRRFMPFLKHLPESWARRLLPYFG